MRVRFKVAPTDWHPAFDKIEYGYLEIWLFAENPDDAASRATAITEQLPYKILGDKASVDANVDKGNVEDSPIKGKIIANIEIASQAGLSFLFHGFAIGSKGKDQFSSDEFLV